MLTHSSKLVMECPSMADKPTIEISWGVYFVEKTINCSWCGPLVWLVGMLKGLQGRTQGSGKGDIATPMGQTTTFLLLSFVLKHFLALQSIHLGSFLQYIGIYFRWIDKLYYIAYLHLIGSYLRQKCLLAQKVPISTKKRLCIWFFLLQDS